MIDLDRSWTIARTLLGAGIVLKSLTWPAAPIDVAAVLLVGGLLALTPRWSRVGFATVAAVGLTVLATDSYYANHFVLLTILSLLAACVPGRKIGRALHPAQILMMVQVSAVYFWAGAWKINAEFLSGSVLLFEWDQAWIRALPASEGLAIGLAALTVILEVLVAVLFWFRSYVRAAAVIGLVLHAGMIVSVGPTAIVKAELVVFALLCGSTYPLFLWCAVASDRTPVTSA